ncbi:DUF814 domain-containing protein [Candidatus Pacearchaeota archaeon]|nr:DUF814 domain-containing protein [Candidatus Pacearchaeota archaeon]
MKFREHITKKGTLVLGGKSAQNNEELIKQIEPNEVVLHTEKPGSPFVNIKGKPKFGDVKEAAIFCARYSQDYRDNKSDVVIHQFKGRDISKDRKMKLGMFGVRNIKKIKIKKKWIEGFLK